MHRSAWEGGVALCWMCAHFAIFLHLLHLVFSPLCPSSSSPIGPLQHTHLCPVTCLVAELFHGTANKRQHSLLGQSCTLRQLSSTSVLSRNQQQWAGFSGSTACFSAGLERVKMTSESRLKPKKANASLKHLPYAEQVFLRLNRRY